MSHSDADTYSLGQRRLIAFIQCSVIALAFSAWLLPGEASAQVTVELSNTATVPGGITVVPFTFTGDGSADYFEGEIEYPTTDFQVRFLSWCLLGSNVPGSCEPGEPGIIEIFIGPGTDVLETFTGYLVFNTNIDADPGTANIVWVPGSLDAGASDVDGFDGQMVILDSSELVLSSDPASIDFGFVEIGTGGAFQTVEICGTNDDGGSLWVLNIQADNEDFFVESDAGTCPESFPFDLSLQAGECCTKEIFFDPGESGLFEIDLEIFGSVGLSAIPLRGFGVPAGGTFEPSMAPPNFDFGLIVTHDPPSPQTFTVSNDGTGIGTIDDVFIDGDDEFTIVGGTCMVPEFPLVLGPSSSCTIQVGFIVTDIFFDPEDFSANLVVETSADDLSSLLQGSAVTIDPIFSDRFEVEFFPFPLGRFEPMGSFFECSLANWSFLVDVSNDDVGNPISPFRRYSGECGLRIEFDGIPQYIEDQSPLAESSYNVRFYGFFDEVIGTVRLFQATDHGDPRFRITYSDGDLILDAFDNDSNPESVTVPAIGTGWHSIEVAWEAAENAEILLSVNGAPDVSVVLDNSNLRINSVQLGSLVHDGQIGAVHLDAFESRRVTRPGRLLVGDANGDGVVDLFDLVAIDAELDAEPVFARGQPDCTEDGLVNLDDRECIGAIIAGGDAIEFTLDQLSAFPGQEIELSGFLDSNPFGATSVWFVAVVDPGLLEFRDNGSGDCGFAEPGADLGGEHDLICEEFALGELGVAVIGSDPVPEGELFRLLLTVDSSATEGDTPVLIEDPEFYISGLELPSTMLSLNDGLVGVFDPIADLVLDPESHDFGPVEQPDFPVSQVFTVTNAGEEGSVGDIELVSLAGNGAFAIIDDTCSDSSLGLGEDCSITVQFDAANLLPGKYSAALQFIADPPIGPAALAGIRVGIVDFDLVPDSADFGSVFADADPVIRIIELVNTGELPIEVDDIDFELSGGPAFSVVANACTPGLVLEPDDACPIELAFLGGSQAPGSYVGFFQASSSTSSVTVGLAGVRAPTAAMTVAPLVHDFGGPTVPEFPVTQLFTVSNTGEPGSSTSVSSTLLSGSGLFAFTANTCPGATLGAGQSCSFTVAFNASDAPLGSYSAAVEVVSDIDSAVVALSGSRVPSVISLGVSPDIHSFGALEADDLPAEQVFTVAATGDEGLSIMIDEVFLGDDFGFAILADDCGGVDLFVGQSCQIVVSFDPLDLEPGDYSSTLEIASEQPLVVALSGQYAVTPPQPDIFVLPAPANQSAGVASFIGQDSLSGTGRMVSAAGRIGPAATSRVLVSVPAEGAVYLLADGEFNAPAEALNDDLFRSIRFQLADSSPDGISLAGAGDFRASGHSAIALGDRIGGRILLLFGGPDTTQGPATVDLTEVSGNGADVGAGFRAIVLEGSGLSGEAFELAFIGDFNGNGHDDLAIGLPNHGSAGEGRVYVVFGNGSDSNIDLDALGAGQGVTIDGTAAMGGLGFSLAGAGDFNGDGLADLVIGAPFADDYGHVAVVFGSSSPGSLSVAALDGSNGFVARMPVEDSTGPRFGYSVAGAGDFDGDGYADIIVGAPRSLVTGQPSAPGQARILFGVADVGSGDVSVDEEDGLRQMRINPFSVGSNSLFGFSVAGLGDASRNGLGDVAIGDPGYGDPINNPSLPRFTGQAYAVFGRSDPPTSLVVEELDGSEATLYRPQQQLARAGWTVAGVGDFSGDGFPDLMVTGPGGSTQGLSEEGQVWIVGGRETALDKDPVIETILPPTGIVAGGEPVTIIGRHFLEGAEVWFADQPCLDVQRIDHTELRCLTPPADAASVDVSVINPDGTGTTLDEAFRFLEPTTLALSATAFPGQFGQAGRLAEFEVLNSGDFTAEQLVLTVSTAGTDIFDWFSLAPLCELDGQTVACDFGEVPAWRCSTSASQATCTLANLPGGARASVLLDFGGTGPVASSLTLTSVNADNIETDAELFGANE